MTTNYNRLRELFIAACDLSRDDQQQFVNAHCDHDHELRSDLLRLLEEDSSPNSILADDVVAMDFIDDDILFDDGELPTSIGRFKPKLRLGAGGMGVVYLAEQHNPRRDVAVKVIRRGHVDRNMLRRFELEAAMLARMQHPNIAQVYEAGTFDDGSGPRPYFAMEYIDGVPLTRYVRDSNMSVRDRLALFTTICDAVHHAHQRGIVHRDLKPANILVTESAQPKILDFGVARATDADLHRSTHRTNVGQLIGTLTYMSPEQVVGRADDIDVRCDVYALGVILYELLADRLPYNLVDHSIVAAGRVITECEPESLATIDRSYRGDLNTIVLKALEKDREHRYQAASDLAGDVLRYLRDEPIMARPATAIYQIRKFARRNRGLAAGVAAVFVTLTLGIVGTTWGLVRTVDHAKVAAHESQRAQQAEAEAAQRASELAQVVDFQSRQISRIDPVVVGERIREHITAQLHRSLMDAEGDDATAAVHEIEQALSNIDYTSLALEIVDETTYDWALREINIEFDDQPLVKAHLLHNMSTSMRWAGLIEQAEQPQLEALEIRQRLLGETHPLTLDSMFGVGRLFKVQGKLDQAELYLQRAMNGRRAALGPDHPKTLKAVNVYGIVLRLQNRLEEAETYYRAALEGFQRTLPDNHQFILFSMANLGSLLRDMGRIDEAEPLTRQALEGKRAKFGDDHLETLVSSLDLGILLQSKQNFDEAEVIFRDTLDRCKRLLGDGHFTTLETCQLLGEVLHRQGRLDEAEHHYRQALRGRQRVLGGDHAYTKHTAGRLATLLIETDRPEEAALLDQP